MPKRPTEEPAKGSVKSATKIVTEFIMIEKVKKLFKKFGMSTDGVEFEEKRLKVNGIQKLCCFVAFADGKTGISEYLYNFYLHDLMSSTVFVMEVLPPTDTDEPLMAVYELTEEELSA